MKIFKMTLLAALISSPLAAETIDKTWELGVFGDYIKSSTHKEGDAYWHHIEAGKGIGLDLQKIINDSWNVRFELARDRYDVYNGADNDYGSRYGLDALYKIQDSDFYLFSGVRRFNNVRSYNAVDAGVGFERQISDRFSVYSEAVVYHDIDYGFTDQGFKLGIKYSFGDERQAPVVKPQPVAVKPVVNNTVALDSDNDGVIDSKDRCANTPANVKVDSVGCTLYSENAVDINLNVAFENNSSEIKSNVINDIQRLADFMKEYEQTSVVIEGHSSAVGDAAYNLMLSQKRADAVKAVLVNTFNIDASRLTAKGVGETQLLAKGNTLADHRSNRRVVAQIETTVKKAVTKD
ncbi:OmpA family protein [Thalassotalea piscium]